MENFYILIDILKQTNEFDKLDIKDNKIGFNGNYMDFTNFDFQDFYVNNPNFINNLANLNEEAIFKILEIHAKFYNKKNKEEEITEEKFEEVTQDNAILKKFHLIKNNKRIEEKEKNYIYYQDNFGENHLFNDITGKELLKMYNELTLYRGANVTEEDLLNYLSFRKKELKLECLNEAKMRYNASEEHLNNLKYLNEKNSACGNTLDTPLGNDEEKIYLSNGLITTFNMNKNNEYVRENHDISENGNLSEDDNLNKEDSPVEEKVEEKIPLITFDSYEKLILQNNEYSNDQKDKIKVFENYIFDIIVYKDFLIPELYEYYERFMNLGNYLYTIKNPNKNISDTIDRYEDMFERSKNVTLENVPDKVQKLIRTKPNQNNVGYTTIAIYKTLLIIAMGLLFAIYIIINM